MPVSMPVQKPHNRSRQDYETPWELIRAVEARLGTKFRYDLAATEKNCKAEGRVIGDSLAQNWELLGSNVWLWLNPPFADIKPWARKCSESTKCNIAFLVPASVGSEWFAKYVWNKAHVLALRPRISFDGVGPYPKDCILALYTKRLTPAFNLWKWDGGLYK